MAVDRKADYVGNHGGVYTDLSGQTKQFTYIDHDPKPTISRNTKENIEELTASLSAYRTNLIQRILFIPASLCPKEYQDFVIAGDVGVLKWDEKAISDQGMSIDRLRPLCVQLENRAEVMGLSILED